MATRRPLGTALLTALTILAGGISCANALRPHPPPPRVDLRLLAEEKSPGLHPRDISWPRLKEPLSRMLVYSACLGPLLDNYHGLFGVLTYREGLPFVLRLQDQVVLKTALWVPPLFGLAGVVMSALVLLLDRQLGSPPASIRPSWSKVFYGIAFFSSQYYLSGLLDFLGVDSLLIHLVLASLAIAGWTIFDATLAGLLLGIATAVAGPLAEVLLTSQGLYTYSHADVLGVCSWIPWVYFLGAPAVGNLARRTCLDSQRQTK